MSLNVQEVEEVKTRQLLHEGSMSDSKSGAELEAISPRKSNLVEKPRELPKMGLRTDNQNASIGCQVDWNSGIDAGD